MNGQEKDEELGAGVTTADYWEYDAKLARRWNVDPVVKVHESPYATFANNPIWFMDLQGADSTNSTACGGNVPLPSSLDGGVVSGVELNASFNSSFSWSYSPAPLTTIGDSPDVVYQNHYQSFDNGVMTEFRSRFSIDASGGGVTDASNTQDVYNSINDFFKSQAVPMNNGSPPALEAYGYNIGVMASPQSTNEQENADNLHSVIGWSFHDGPNYIIPGRSSNQTEGGWTIFPVNGMGSLPATYLGTPHDRIDLNDGGEVPMPVFRLTNPNTGVTYSVYLLVYYQIPQYN
jgi:hypothetical protein